MRRSVISSASFLSVVLSTILTLSAIYSGIGVAKADSVIATIPVGGEGIAFDSANGNLYITGNGVSVISGQTNTVIGSPVPVGSSPRCIAFDSANGNLYVTNREDNTVSVISGQTNTVIGSPIAVGLNPEGIAFDPANGNLYVANYNDNTVSVISGRTNTVIGSPISVGLLPFGITFDSANGNLYVAKFGNSVSVISGQTNTEIATVPTGTATSAIAFDSANGNLYATFHEGGVTVISGQTNQIIAGIDGVGRSPDGIAFDSANGNLYVTNAGSGTVSVISGRTNTVIGSPISVGLLPFGIAFDSANGNLYVANADAVSVISTTPIQPIPPDTIIASSFDGNGAMIQNGGTTTSSSTKIAFTATQGTNPIAGFQCSLDNRPFSSCSSPVDFNNLAAGQHKFAVVAVDTAGNKDPSPATFSWTILTPAQAIQQLIQLKHGMHLSPATDQPLDIRLNVALQFAQNNIKSDTCIQLTVFIKLVLAELRVGQVSSVQAAQLIQGAQNIQTALGCTSGNGIVASSASQPAPSPLNQSQSPRSLQPQTTTSSPFLFQPQSQSPYPYPNQYRYPSQYPYLSQIPQLQNPRLQLPIANAGISQTVTESAEVLLDGRSSYSPTGGVVVGYQWTQLATTGVPVLLVGANTTTPTFTVPMVPTDTVLAFSLRVLDNHGSISTNPSVVYVTVKHNPNNIGTIGGNTPRTNVIPPQQQQQSIVPNNNEISPHSHQHSPIIPIPSQQTMK